MRFVPVQYESADEFLSSRWTDGGEGITVLNHLGELILGEDVILEIKVRGATDQTVVRGTVVWKRDREDPMHRLPPGAGVRVHERDLDKVSVLSRQLGAGRRT